MVDANSSSYGFGAQVQKDQQGVPLNRIALFINGYPTKPDEVSTSGVPVIRISQLTDPSTRTDFIDPSDVPEEKILKDNDLILSWSGTIGTWWWTEGKAVLNQHLFRVVPSEGINKRYLFYALQWVIPFLEDQMHGSTMTHITREALRKTRLPIPDSPEQTACANFLDYQTSRLGQLIEKKKRLLETLREKRTGIMEERLTPGLDASDDFGTAFWSTNLPDEWELCRGKGLFREVDIRSEEGTESLFSLRKEEGLVLHSEVSDKEFEPEDLIGYKKVRPGQLVMNRMRAATGLVGVAPSIGLVSPDYAVFQPTEQAYPYFYQMLFQTELFKTIFRSRSKGLGSGSAGFLRLYTDRFLELWSPQPSIRVQKEIVAEINQQLNQVNEVAKETEESVHLLQERRRAVIAEAVTGQIDVSNWEPPNEKQEATA